MNLFKKIFSYFKPKNPKLKHLVVAWDIDGTLVDSTHRVSFKEDGSFDLDQWINCCTEEHIMKDSLLPSYDIFMAYQAMGFTQICVTARVLCEADYKFFKKHNMKFDAFLHREDSTELDQLLKSKKLKAFFEQNDLIPYSYWDDKQENLEVADKFGLRTFHASYMNEKLTKNNIREVNFTPKEFV